MKGFEFGARTALVLSLSLAVPVLAETPVPTPPSATPPVEAPKTVEPPVATPNIIPGEHTFNPNGESIFLHPLLSRLKRNPLIDWDSLLSPNRSCDSAVKMKAYYYKWFRDRSKFKRDTIGNYSGVDQYDQILAKVMLKALKDHYNQLGTLIKSIEGMPAKQQADYLKRFYEGSRGNRQMTEEMLNEIFRGEIRNLNSQYKSLSCPANRIDNP